MSLNSSNASQIFPPSNVSSIYYSRFSCLQSTVGIGNMTLLTFIGILYFPVYVFILHLGYQKWRRSSTLSHFDLITYQVVVIELVNIIACIFCCCGIYADILVLIVIGAYYFPFELTAQMLFQILTCMEQYLAVVHPVTYLGLRTANMKKIRNVTFGFVWVLCAISMGTMFLVDELASVLLAALTIAFCLFFIIFFSISVLSALTQSKPGEAVGERQPANRIKLRAFYTIMSILGLLLVRCGSNFLTLVNTSSLHIGENTKCGLWMSLFWWCLPSSMMLPLMFLQKEGKLPCFKKNRN